VLVGGRGVQGSVVITSLAVSTGLLWVGTNVGLALTVPLPRLGGVPSIYSSANISYHAHHGPVRVFLPINQTVVDEDPPLLKKTYRMNSTSQDTIEEEPDKTPVHKQISATSLTKRYTSPRLAGRVPLVARKQSEPSRTCKTLPRGFSLAAADPGDSLYGLYEDLLNVQDYDVDNIELNTSRQNVHKSDPELNTIPYRVSTLDRRMTMKLQRPRSLDLSSWSVESRSSSHTNSSSDGSEKTCSPSVSRNASFLSTRSVEISRSQSVRRAPKANKEISHRTVTTLMGGRGYINWLNLRANQGKLNSQDACVILWDQKV